MDISKGEAVVVVGGILHESNSFNPDLTVLSDFALRESDWESGNTEVAGFLEEGAKAGLRLVRSIYAEAAPKGPVDPAAFEYLTGRLISAIQEAPRCDGVLLALHGAMYAEAYPHADREIVRRVRSAIGADTPFVVTHDFHANIAPDMVGWTDALVTYQQNPHLDTRQRGARAARILARMLQEGIRPRQAIVKPPMMWNIAFQNTYEEPLRSITAASQALEDCLGILAASVSGGYQYNDVEFMGPSVVVVAENDAALAQREAQRLADLMWSRRDSILLQLPDAEQAVREAMQAERGPVALFDAGDNIGGGSTGDETFVLEQLLAQGARGWVVVLYDPAGVAAAKSAGIDGTVEFEAGGHARGAHSRAVGIRGMVRSLHCGRYVEPAVRHGGKRYWDMGHAAVIEVGPPAAEEQNLLIVTERRSSPNSLHELISCGIYPERQKILVAKGTIAPRAAYEPVAARIVLVDTPGVTAMNPARFEFHGVRPGLWGMEPL